MGDVHLKTLFAWQHCQNCMLASEIQDTPERLPGRCPGCGETGYLQSWPPEPSRMLLRSALGREIDDYESLATAGFLVAAALDSLLQWILLAAVEYLAPEGRRGSRMAQQVRDPGVSTEQRLHLLKNLTDLGHKEVAERLGEPAFPSLWRGLRDRRDRFVQSCDSSAFQSVSKAEMTDVARMAVKVFAHLNNMVW